MTVRLKNPAGAALIAYLPYGHTPPGDDVDWASSPPPYKTFPSARREVLPWEVDSCGSDRELLGRFLRDLCGLTRVRWVHWNAAHGKTIKPVPGRPTPSGGALYPLEVYVAAGGADLAAALYHYDPAHHALNLLRVGDHRQALLGALSHPPGKLPAVVLVFSSRFWRTGFKYREFGYRLQNQETGVLAAQALAVADQLQRTAAVRLQFVDERVNTLLGLDPGAESAMAIVLVGDTNEDHAGASDEELAVPVPTAVPAPLSISERLPRTMALHAATFITTPPGGTTTLPAAAEPMGLTWTLPEVVVRPAAGIFRRFSPADGFRPQAVGLDALAGILSASSKAWTGELPCRAPIVLYCLAFGVIGLPSRVYRYDPGSHTLAEMQGADIQAWAATEAADMIDIALAHASAILLPVGDLTSGVGSFGDRWYRILQAEVGGLLHRSALAAAALGLASRIHSSPEPDFHNALGIRQPGHSVLSALALGTPRTASTLESTSIIAMKHRST